MSLGSFRYNKGSWTTNYCGLRQSGMLRLGQSSIFKSLGSSRAWKTGLIRALSERSKKIFWENQNAKKWKTLRDFYFFALFLEGLFLFGIGWLVGWCTFDDDWLNNIFLIQIVPG